MRRLIIFICLLFSCVSGFSCNVDHRQEKQNIAIVKNMFSEFAEKLDINKLDTYYSKDFILESNGEHYDYQAYKKLEGDIYKTLSSLKVTRYDDIFTTANKVVSRMTIKLVHQDGKTNEFQLI